MLAITQRQATLAILVLLIIVCGGAIAVEIIVGMPPLYFWTATVAFIIYGILGAAYWRGIEQARPVAAVTITLVTAISCSLLTLQTGQIIWGIIVSPIVALIMSNALFVAASGIMTLLIGVLITLSLRPSPYTEPLTLLIYAVALIGMVIARIVMDTHRRAAEAAATDAREAQRRAEANAAEVALRAAELEQANTQQQRLIDLVATLELPAIPVADRVLLTPIIGRFDHARAQRLTEFLLQRVYQDKIKHVILDLTAMQEIEETTVQDLLHLVQAVQLIGCQITLSGISAATAQHLVGAEMNLPHSIQITRSPQEALLGVTYYQATN